MLRVFWRKRKSLRFIGKELFIDIFFFALFGLMLTKKRKMVLYMEMYKLKENLLLFF